MSTQDEDELKGILYNVANFYAKREFKLDGSDYAAIDEAVKKLQDREQSIKEQAEIELLEFAIEVVQQYAYEPSDGVCTSGGLSTLESAFVILGRNGLLNKKGQYVPAALHSTNNSLEEK